MVSIVPTVSNPILFSEYAQTLPDGSATRIFVENMVNESDLLRAVPVMPATAGKREFMDIANIPAVGFRSINQGGNQGLGSFNLRSEDTFFIDEYVFVDRAMIDRLGEQHEGQQVKLKTTALAQMFSSKFIKGDNSSANTEPNGLQVRCVNTSGNAQNLFYNSVAAGGGALALTNLDILYWSVNKPTHWVFPRSLMPYADAAARNSSITGATFAYLKDDIGRRIIAHKGLPILFGYEPDDTPDLLPMTEVGTGGGGAVTGSIYCASFREGGIYAIEQTPLSVMPEGYLVGTPQKSTHIKWDWGIAREHPRSVSRLSSIAAGAFTA